MIKFFNEKEEAAIIKSIQEAEQNTSGEIRVHLHEAIDKSLMQDAKMAFRKMGMQKTRARNGVLVFLVPAEKKFAILGDKGINEVVPDDFWEEVKDKMQHFFRRGLFADGVCAGIEQVGAQLGVYFPYQNNDKNELSNEISYQEEE
ncbi:MAG TPA: TPM domain-containing protein [Saprospiraceae bacterium]|nr:TPM domain-containing protein [Saprospiraceae bacterium]